MYRIGQCGCGYVAFAIIIGDPNNDEVTEIVPVECLPCYENGGDYTKGLDWREAEPQRQEGVKPPQSDKSDDNVVPLQSKRAKREAKKRAKEEARSRDQESSLAV